MVACREGSEKAHRAKLSTSFSIVVVSIHVLFPFVVTKHSRARKKEKSSTWEENTDSVWIRIESTKSERSEEEHRKNYLAFYCVASTYPTSVENTFFLVYNNNFYSTAWSDNVRLKRMKLTVFYSARGKDLTFMAWTYHWKISYKGHSCRLLRWRVSHVLSSKKL